MPETTNHLPSPKSPNQKTQWLNNDVATSRDHDGEAYVHDVPR
jgi:hypothetical protein